MSPADAAAAVGNEEKEAINLIMRLGANGQEATLRVLRTLQGHMQKDARDSAPLAERRSMTLCVAFASDASEHPARRTDASRDASSLPMKSMGGRIVTSVSHRKRPIKHEPYARLRALRSRGIRRTH